MTRPDPIASFGAHDRRALRSVAIQFFVNGAVVASFVPRLPEIRDRVDITVGELGLFLTVAGVVGLLGSAVASRIISGIGTRRLIVVGGVLLAGSLAVVGVSPSPGVLVAGLVGLSLFDVLVDIPMNMQGSWLSARRHAPVMNRLHGLWSLGTVVGGLCSAQLAAAAVPVATHALGAAVLFAIAVVYVGRGLLVEDEFADNPSKADERPLDGALVPPRRSLRLPLILLALAGGAALAMEQTSTDWAAFRLTDDFGSSAAVAGLAYVAYTGGMTTARMAGDWVQVRLGATTMTRSAIVVAAIGLAAASLGPNRWTTLIGYAVAGLGVATLLPKIYDDAAKMPGPPGHALGVMTGSLRIAGLVAPAIVGLLATTSLSVGQAVAAVTLPSAAVFLIQAFSDRFSPAIPELSRKG